MILVILKLTQMDFMEPTVQINGNNIENEVIPLIPTSPRVLKKNNFGTFIRNNKIFGNPSDNLKDAIQDVSEKKVKSKDNELIQNTLFKLLDTSKKDELLETVTVKTTEKIPTKLNELENTTDTKTILVRRIDYSEEEKINNTDKLIATLDVIKKKYKTIKLPKYDSETAYDKLLIYVECAKTQIKQRKKISKYKLLLGGLFLGIELFMTYILNMDPENFTLNQLKNMDQYEVIFNELQDIGIDRAVEEWSPLFRILWIMGIHILVFFGAKLLAKIFGGDIGELQKLISGFLNGKTIEDMDVDDGEEESMISKIYGIIKAFTSMRNMGKIVTK
jgi:hypothetical protein